MHERSKHFAVMYFFVNELVREGAVKIVYCRPTASMVSESGCAGARRGYHQPLRSFVATTAALREVCADGGGLLQDL